MCFIQRNSLKFCFGRDRYKGRNNIFFIFKKYVEENNVPLKKLKIIIDAAVAMRKTKHGFIARSLFSVLFIKKCYVQK